MAQFNWIERIYIFRSREFNEFLAKCLVKDPDQRPTAAQLLEVRESILLLTIGCYLYQLS